MLRFKQDKDGIWQPYRTEYQAGKKGPGRPKNAEAPAKKNAKAAKAEVALPAPFENSEEVKE